MTLDGTEIIVECPNGRYTNAEVSVKTHVNQFPSAMLLAVWFCCLCPSYLFECGNCC